MPPFVDKLKKKFTRPGKKVPRDAGVVSDAPQQKFTEAEILASFKGLSFDPMDLTEKIIDFGKALTGIPLYKYQYNFAFRVILAVITFQNETLTALWSRQSGKSEDMAFIIDTLMVILPVLSKMYPEFRQFEKGFKIGLYAPQQLQVDTTYERAFDRISSENAEYILEDPEIDTGLASAKYLSLTNGSALTGQVASKASKIESKTYHLIIVEESQDADDYVVQKSIEPMISATGGTILKVGTTGTKKNAFYNDILFNKKRQRIIRDERLLSHFEFDYLKVIHYKREQFNIDGNIFHLHYEKDVLKKREKWGKDSDAFKLGYALIWPLESGMFMTDAQFERICNKRLGIPNEIPSDWLMVAGLDFAKDQDSTVITIGRTFYKDDAYTTEPPMKQVCDWVELKHVDYESQHHIILDTLIKWNVQIAYCDYTGVGKPVVDRLIAACGGDVIIIPYTFSRPSKSDMYTALSADVQSARLQVPASKLVKQSEEFINFENQMKGLYKSYEAGFMVCQHGDSTGDHDDYPDSLALFTMAANHELPDEPEETENFLFEVGSNAYISARNAHW